MATQSNVAAGSIPVPGNKFCNRRFARTRRPNKGGHRSRVDGKIYTMQNFMLFIIRESYILEFNFQIVKRNRLIGMVKFFGI